MEVHQQTEADMPEGTSQATRTHAADPAPEQLAYDVCVFCGQAITLAFDGTSRLVTTLTNNPECYGK
jgi:hypothetical protein